MIYIYAIHFRNFLVPFFLIVLETLIFPTFMEVGNVFMYV